MSDINLMPFIQAIIGFLAAVVVRFVVPWIKAKTTLNQREIIINAVRVTVQAAEQILGDKDGKARKKYVSGQLTTMGFKIDPTELDAMIEAVVYEINNALLVSDDIIDLTVNEND